MEMESGAQKHLMQTLVVQLKMPFLLIPLIWLHYSILLAHYGQEHIRNILNKQYYTFINLVIVVGIFVILMSVELLGTERNLVLCNAQYVYNLGEGSGSDDLPSKDSMDPYISYFATLFDNEGKIFCGTYKKLMNIKTYYYYDFEESSWNPISTSSARHRGKFDSL